MREIITALSDETIFNQIEKVTNPERFTITSKQVQYGKNLITIKEYKKN
jgi:hypothetical protein